jgi:pimeloyl-ACP methyl ester carboxylesterase
MKRVSLLSRFAQGTTALLKNSASTPLPAKPKSNLKQWLVFEALSLSAGWVLLSPFVAMPLYNRMLFFPDKTDYSTTIAGAIKQLKDELKVTTTNEWIPTADGHKLNAIYYIRPGAKKVFLLSHGNAGNVQGRVLLAAALLCCNCNVLSYDYEGYGKSDGEPSIKGLVKDGLAAYDFTATKLHYSANQIILYGESIGSGVSVQIAAQRPVSGIVLQSAFSSLLAAGREHVWFLNLYPIEWFDNLDNITYLETKHPPLLILHGDCDPILATHHGQDIYNRAAQPKTIVILTHFGHVLENVDNMQFLRAVGTFVNALGGTKPAK